MQPQDVAAGSGRYDHPRYRAYVLGVLTLVIACHAVDRNIAIIVIEPVKAEFGLSDTQMGLLSGMAYGVAFALAGIPVGYLSDRINRRNLLATLLVLWSGLTAICGLARSYPALVLARMGVGAAEAGASPTALPMIADIYPPQRRATAFGIYYLSQPIGMALSFQAGGWIAAEYGWRTAFFVAGIPGLILAAILFTTVRDPARGATDPTPDATVPATPTLGQTLAHIARSPALWMLYGGCVLLATTVLSVSAWIGSFFVRTHHMDLKEVGAILGLAGGAAGLVCAPAMGWLADRLTPHDPRWPLWVVAISALAAIGAGLCMLYLPGARAAIAGYVAFVFLTHGYSPPAYAMLMGAVPAQMRGTAMSLMQLLTSLIGVGAGPTIAGALSDAYGGRDSLQPALATMLLVNLAVAALMYGAAQRLFAPPARHPGQGRA
ncbi:MAG: spinster family MFS transporter [Gammaproteobacteria bacterium]